MELSIDLQNRTQYIDLPAHSIIQHWVETALISAQYDKESDLTISFIENEEMQALNRTYRGKDRPTNVLSFPFDVPDHIESHIPTLGDILIALTVITQEAQEQEKTFEDHLAHMVVHGTLHLLGFDHISEEEAEEMEHLEITILAALGIDNPYN